MIIKYTHFIKESLRDKMVGKSEEEIIKNISDPTPENILKNGADSGMMGLIDLALERGADVNHNLAESLLMAAMRGNINITKKLLKYGADPNLGFKHCVFTIYRKHQIMKLLIEYGLDVNYNDGELLVYAVNALDYDLIQLLLDNGANPNAQNGEPLRQILRFDNSRIVSMLLDAGADIHINNDEFIKNMDNYWEGVYNSIKRQLKKEE